MKRTILICGHGPGISDAVARKFQKEGHPVALVARNADRLAGAATALGAQTFPCDLNDVGAMPSLVERVRAALGPIGVVHWNAYARSAGDLATASTAEMRSVFDVSVHSLIACVQAALPDLKAEKGSVLITGGGFAIYDPKVDAMAVQFQSMGLAVGKAAQHKLAGLLHARLAAEGVYVGEVVVRAIVKGTSFDRGGTGTLEASKVADAFWELHSQRKVASVDVF